MINNRIPTVFGILVVLGLALPANAAENIPERPAVATPGNAAEASAILGAKLLVCNTCHGENGVPRSISAAVISGQQENYLMKQLHDFQSGDRKNDVMTWMATALSQEELGPTAAFFAKKSWPARTVAVAAASQPPIAAVCQICHQQNFVGGLAAPRLAGQSYEYLIAAMSGYAEGKRTNNADMMKVMQAISPADREAMARYLSSL